MRNDYIKGAQIAVLSILKVAYGWLYIAAGSDEESDEPKIKKIELPSCNSYLIIEMDMAVYGNDTGKGGFNGVPFELTFQKNSDGHASNVSISSITKENGSALEGGETKFKLNLDVTDTPNGNEQITVNPKKDAVYSEDGEAADPNSKKSINLNNQSPKIKHARLLTNKNTTIRIEMDTPVFGSNGGNGELSNEAFELTLSPQSGLVISEVSLTPKSDDDPETAETLFDLEYQIEGTPNGTESIQIAPAADKIFTEDGCVAETSESKTVNLNDNTVPEIEEVSLIDNRNTSVNLKMNTPVYGTDDGTGGLDVNSFEKEMTCAGGEATKATITGITRPNGESTQGGDREFKLTLSIEGTPNGQEKIIFQPSENKIFALAGNTANPSNGKELALNDNRPPDAEIIRLADDNRFLEIEFNTPVYGKSDGTGGISIASFQLPLNTTEDSNVSVQITAIHAVDNSQASIPAGGEKKFKLSLGIEGAPNGNETISIKPIKNKIFAKAGAEATGDPITFNLNAAIT